MAGSSQPAACCQRQSWQKKRGFRGVIVPKENAREAAILSDIRVIPVADLKEFVSLCRQEFDCDCFYRTADPVWETT